MIIVIMSIQLVAIEGYEVSPVKVILMGLCSLYFIFQLPINNKAFFTGSIYFTVCFGVALLHGNMRVSTIGYLGLFIITYIVYYYLIYSKAFSLEQFKQILKFIIVAYCVILILQQFSVILGIKNFALINLAETKHSSAGGVAYYQWNHLPALSCEPSHTACIISAIMLGYIRCLEIEQGATTQLKTLFNKQNRLVTICFLWLICTMGSGTGWIGLGLISLYFIRIRNILYIGPIFILLGAILYHSENKSLHRAISAAQATLTGNIKEITEADPSGAVRIVPLVNTLLFTDLSQKKSWIGDGTLSEDDAENAWKNLTRKIAIVDQYGLLGFFASLILVYSCAIRRFFSIETLFFTILYLLSLSNVYIAWSPIYIFTAIRYFQTQQKSINSFTKKGK